jgi:tRNA threonylcarbamoyladenosine biosynthesis protein TsaB
VVGVTRLEAIAEGSTGLALVAIDAHRDAFYVQCFADGAPVGPPDLIEAAALDAHAPGAARLGGASACGSERGAVPDPVALARVALRRIGTALPPPAPLYLRPADAAPAAERPPRLLDDA